MSEPKRPTGWGGPPLVPPGPADAEAAARRIRGVAVRTPLLQLSGSPPEAPIFLKPEVLQPSGAYKLRGVCNWAASLTPEERARGFCTHSSGNTALALGHVARLFGASARSVMPDWVPPHKLEAIRACGVEPAPMPLDDLLAFIFEGHWRRQPYCYLNPWADPHMLAGNGTLALEILADLPDIDTLFVPVGGGGLVLGVGGVLKKLKPSVRVVGVQAEACPALHASFAAGKPVWVEARPTVCDGTTLPLVVEELYPALRATVDDVALVSEEGAKEAVRALALGNKLVVEGAGAMVVAAALATPAAERGRAACILSGGSIGADKLAEILRGHP